MLRLFVSGRYTDVHDAVQWQLDDGDCKPLRGDRLHAGERGFD